MVLPQHSRCCHSPPLPPHSSVSASGLWATCNANSEEEGCEKEPFSTSSSLPLSSPLRLPPALLGLSRCYGRGGEANQASLLSLPLLFPEKALFSLSVCLGKERRWCRGERGGEKSGGRGSEGELPCCVQLMFVSPPLFSPPKQQAGCSTHRGREANGCEGEQNKRRG